MLIKFFAAIPFLFYVSYTTTTQTTPTSPVVVNLNQTFNNSATAPTTNTVHQTASQQTQQTSLQQVVQQSKQFIDALMRSKDQLITQLPTLYAYIKGVFWEHAFLYSTIIVWSIYSVLYLQIVRDIQYVKNAKLWSQWQPEKTLAELCAQPQECLCKELIIAIQCRINHNNPVDCVTPLCNFLNDLDKEEQRLKKFQRFMHYLSKIYLHKVLPFSASTQISVQQSLDKLAFIRHLFISWASNRNWQEIDVPVRKHIYTT